MTLLGFPLALEDADLVLVDEQDAPEMYALIDAERAHLRPYLPWVDQAREPAFIAAYLRDARRRREGGEGFECGLRVGGRLVGGVGLHHVDLRNRSAEIGYWLARAATGRGLVTRAVEAVTDRAFTMGFHRIEIRVWPGNPKSGAVAARAGYVREAVLRDAGWHPDGFRDLEVWAKLAP